MIFTADDITKARSINKRVAAMRKQAMTAAKDFGEFKGNPNLLNMSWPHYGDRPLTSMPQPNTSFMHQLGRGFSGAGNYIMGAGTAATVGINGQRGMVENLGGAAVDSIERLAHGQRPSGQLWRNAITQPWSEVGDQARAMGYDRDFSAPGRWMGRNVGYPVKSLWQSFKTPEDYTPEGSRFAPPATNVPPPFIE